MPASYYVGSGVPSEFVMTKYNWFALALLLASALPTLAGAVTFQQ
jgi:hypothetical protein